MHLLYIITRLDDRGGAQAHLRDLLSGFDQFDLHVSLIGGGQSIVSEWFGADGGIVHTLPPLAHPIKPFKDLKVVWQLRQWILKHRPAIICLHSSKAGALGRIAAMGTGIPVVFTAHGWAFTEGVPPFKRSVYKQIERLLARLSTRIITVSEYDRSLALRERVGDRHKVVTVHNGVHDTDEPRAEPAINPPQLIMVARFAEPKDHVLLLHALADLQDLNWGLELVGDGPNRLPAEALVKKLGLARRVRFAGACEAVAADLSRAQLFVLASQWEGLPLSIIEAMRAGLPVIASDVGGVNELVDDGKTGYLVPRSAKRNLTERLRQLLEDPAKRVAMGAAGRQRYEAHFTFNRMFESTLEVYRQAIAQAKKP